MRAISKLRLPCAVPVIVLIIVLGITASPAVADRPEPSVIGVTYKQGSSSVDVVLAIPVHLYHAAQHARFGIDVTVTYLSELNAGEIIDSGRASIKLDTTFLDFIDDDNVAVLLKVALGATTPPGGTPNYTSTVELLSPGRK
jgi:hypothetical protein